MKQAILQGKRYIDESKRIDPQKKQELQEPFDLAMQAMQDVNKRMKTGNAIPEGGSSISLQDKIKDLFESFGLTKRIGR